MQYKTKIQYQEHTVHQVPLNTFPAILEAGHSDESNGNK